VRYAQRRWGVTWWRLTTGVTGHYNAAATGATDDEKTGSSETHTGDRAADTGLTLSGIR